MTLLHGVSLLVGLAYAVYDFQLFMSLLNEIECPLGSFLVKCILCFLNSVNMRFFPVEEEEEDM
jgi:hypothetical protein